jgi:hypothetical protein
MQEACREGKMTPADSVFASVERDTALCEKLLERTLERKVCWITRAGTWFQNRTPHRLAGRLWICTSPPSLHLAINQWESFELRPEAAKLAALVRAMEDQMSEFDKAIAEAMECLKSL